jgi:hypothetical protein
MSTPHIKEQGEPIHCLIKMEIRDDFPRPRELLKQEARDIILFRILRCSTTELLAHCEFPLF